MAAAVSMSSSSSSSGHAPPEKIVIAGAGLHGSALAYYLTKRGHKDVTVVEQKEVAAAASGKGGGFLARDWGSGPTVQLHKKSFALHAELAEELGIESYRRIPVLSVEPGSRTARTNDICPWLDGDIRQCSVMDQDGGAQVAPLELCTKLMAAAQANGAKLVIGKVEGVEKSAAEEDGLERVTGVVVDGAVLPADAVAVTMGPWASLAEDWFGGMPVPITGIKSTSIVFKSADPDAVEPFALFCGEDDRFGTHLEVYPRNSGEVYLCGIGGSEYVEPERLRAGEFPPGEVHPDPARVQAAAASFSTMSKRLGGEPDTTQACMRPCPPDAMPLMGKIPHVKGAYMSAGHNCWGILWAPVSGLAMSELILDGAAGCVDLSAFRPGRFDRGAGAAGRGGRGRRKGTVAVGEQW
jgi:glycine/D-amino acid oxidase-like deaminating enzyme